MSIYSLVFKALRKALRMVIKQYDNLLGKIMFKLNGVKFKEKLTVNGFAFLDINRKGNCQIGTGCSFNSRIFYNPIGRNQKCMLVVGDGAVLTIGNNVGISSSAIICYSSITIGNNVKIGGNTVVYDSDFHTLDFLERRSSGSDKPNMKPVVIEDDVFIGSHVTILKGVTIGSAAIVAAGSVVSKNIPQGEIWGGNPAQKIK
jgi:acetyltransferase-like isoleucine patch superfamily enzyme